MSKRMICYILSFVLFIEGAAMQIATLTALIYKEKDGYYFLFLGIALMILGGIGIFLKPKSTNMTPRDGFGATALSWIVLSVCGCLPFYISGRIPKFIDALFETVSGFTTTGASILTEVESFSHCMLMWRSFIIWLGGMGVLVFLLALIPKLAGNQNMYLMKAESPGPMVGKFVPKIRTTAAMLYGIYFFLSVLQFVLLIVGGMEPFDAINTTFSTAGTGGFSVKNAGIAAYDSFYLQGVIAVFMMLFAINFTFFFLLIARKFKQAFLLEEVRWFIIIIATVTIIIAFNISSKFDTLYEAFHHSFFQVSSLISSTGFSTADFDLWPQLSRQLLFIVMCIGACAGSTGGGFKVSRIIILVKESIKEFYLLLHPRNVKSVKLDGKAVKHETVRSVSIFLVIYMIVFIASFLIISLDDFDFVSNITAVSATINNTGPGLGIVGPTGSFSPYSTLSKSTLIFNMLAGRLEFLPLIIIFLPHAWRKN